MGMKRNIFLHELNFPCQPTNHVNSLSLAPYLCGLSFDAALGVQKISKHIWNINFYSLSYALESEHSTGRGNRITTWNARWLLVKIMI